MPKRTLALRALSLAAGLMLIAASTADAHSADDPPTGPPTPGGAVFLATDMNGVNAPAADPDGTGRAVIRIQGTQLCYLLQWNNILAPVVGHIHRAPVGSNGPVAVGFWSGQLPDSLRGVTGCVTAAPEVLADIVANPGNYYANVHDANFPGGAIKGQLATLDHGVDFNTLLRLPLTAQLDGMQEVTGSGDLDGRAVGAVRLSGKTTVQYAFTWSAIAQPSAGHIHIGGVAQAGAIVVGFFAAAGGLPASINGISGEVEGDPVIVAQISQNPGAYYVNLHNVEFPAGAIRGQLTRTGG